MIHFTSVIFFFRELIDYRSINNLLVQVVWKCTHECLTEHFKPVSHPKHWSSPAVTRCSIFFSIWFCVNTDSEISPFFTYINLSPRLFVLYLKLFRLRLFFELWPDTMTQWKVKIFQKSSRILNIWMDKIRGSHYDRQSLNVLLISAVCIWSK